MAEETKGIKRYLGERITAILLYLVIAMLLSLTALWIWSGGIAAISRVAGEAKASGGAFTILDSFRLPWQDELLDQYGAGFDTPTSSPESPQAQATEEDLSTLESEYERLQSAAERSEVFGQPSPYRGSVYLRITAATAGNPSDEYVTLEAAQGEQSPVSLRGWSLTSLLTGVRVYLPDAASPFIGGVINNVDIVALGAGERALVSSGHSPVGVSFRENVCTGYLSQLQTFRPPLANACPRADEVVPLSAGSLQRHGAECVDYIHRIPSCTFAMNVPADLPPNCKAFIANTFSHNGCVNASRSLPRFTLDTWRLYLGSSVELWKNNHDVIRLLDERGLTVDAIVY